MGRLVIWIVEPNSGLPLIEAWLLGSIDLLPLMTEQFLLVGNSSCFPSMGPLARESAEFR